MSDTKTYVPDSDHSSNVPSGNSGDRAIVPATSWPTKTYVPTPVAVNIAPAGRS